MSIENAETPTVPYRVAEHLHDGFLGKNDALSEGEIAMSGVSLAFGAVQANTTERIRIDGDIDGRPAYQSLAKDKRGTFHLSTVFTEAGGTHTQYDIRLDSTLSLLKPITDTLFMTRFVELVQSRES